MVYDWLSMEGRLDRMRRKYGQSRWYMGYYWLSMEGRLWRMGRKYDPGTLCLGAD